MASQFPKLPGYVVTHDPTIVNHKKVSHVKLEKVRNAMNVDVPLYKVPAPPLNLAPEHKNDASRSYSHNQYPNRFGADIQEQFEPTFVKLDKQVCFSFKFLNVTLIVTVHPAQLCQLLSKAFFRLSESSIQKYSFDKLGLTHWMSSYKFPKMQGGLLMTAFAAL